jgi:methyl-accepting chemotaxis protein
MVTAAVRNLGNRSNEIGRIVEVITGIADQTNLLALNAAIEAARAGEQGRGFAVVAEEVRKLAEQSRTAAEQISGLIGEIQNDTNNAVTTMDAGGREVAAGTEAVEKAGAAFAAIANAVQGMVARIQEVSAATQSLAAGSQQAVKAVESIAAITEEAAAGSQEVGASAQEQSASVQEIASSSESLAQMAQELQRAVAEFSI